MENETARETEMAKRDKVWVMCSEGERERPMASWKMKRQGKLKWRQATETKRQRRKGEVMCGEGERETPAAARETDRRDGRK
ncbi:hypothetical protein ACOSP7_024556 [Xanthoceras sorbifolium]